MTYDSITLSAQFFDGNKDEGKVTFDVDIVGSDDRDEQHNVGYARLLIFEDTGEKSLLEVADRDSAESIDAMQAALQFVKKNYNGLRTKFAVLATLRISEEHRNNGIGSAALNDILLFLDKIGVHLVVAKPFPISLPEDTSKREIQSGVKRLTEFYFRHKFTRVTKNDTHMVSDLESMDTISFYRERVAI